MASFVPAVEGRTHTSFPPRRLSQCKACGYQVPLTAGTVMHRIARSPGAVGRGGGVGEAVGVTLGVGTLGVVCFENF